MCLTTDTQGWAATLGGLLLPFQLNDTSPRATDRDNSTRKFNFNPLTKCRLSTELDKNRLYKGKREFSDYPQHPSLGQKDSRGNQEKIQAISRCSRRHHLDTLNSSLPLGCPSLENDFRFLRILPTCQPLSYVILKRHLLPTDKKKHLAQAEGRVLKRLGFPGGEKCLFLLLKAWSENWKEPALVLCVSAEACGGFSSISRNRVLVDAPLFCAAFLGIIVSLSKSSDCSCIRR